MWFKLGGMWFTTPLNPICHFIGEFLLEKFTRKSQALFSAGPFLMTSSELEMSKEHGNTSQMINYCLIMVLNTTIPTSFGHSYCGEDLHLIRCWIHKICPKTFWNCYLIRGAQEAEVPQCIVCFLSEPILPSSYLCRRTTVSSSSATPVLVHALFSFNAASTFGKKSHW